MASLSDIGSVNMRFVTGITMAEAQANLAENSAAMALAVVSPPGRLESHVVEAQRRAEVIAESWRTSPRRHTSPTPLTAGLRSVYEDVVAGRLL